MASPLGVDLSVSQSATAPNAAGKTKLRTRDSSFREDASLSETAAVQTEDIESRQEVAVSPLAGDNVITTAGAGTTTSQDKEVGTLSK